MELPSLNLIVVDGPLRGPHTTINAAVQAASVAPGAAVWIGANIPVSEEYSNPLNVPVFDMRGNGSISFGGGGGGTPAGPANSAQYNNAGEFGGSPNVIVDVVDPDFFNYTLLLNNPDSNLGYNLIFTNSNIDKDLAYATMSMANDGSFSLGLNNSFGTAGFSFDGSGNLDFQVGLGGSIILSQQTIVSRDDGDGTATLAFFAQSTPQIKQVVTGTKLPADDAMVSLLAALSAYGLITDSTS